MTISLSYTFLWLDTSFVSAVQVVPNQNPFSSVSTPTPDCHLVYISLLGYSYSTPVSQPKMRHLLFFVSLENLGRSPSRYKLKSQGDHHYTTYLISPSSHRTSGKSSDIKDLDEIKKGKSECTSCGTRSGNSEIRSATCCHWRTEEVHETHVKSEWWKPWYTRDTIGCKGTRVTRGTMGHLEETSVKEGR